jgi:hypothetical protein
MSEQKRMRIIFDIYPELKTQIKVIAARRNETMARWISRAIIKQLAEETKYDKRS